MRFQSPLSNLSDVLSQVKDAAKHYQETLTRNEAATRAALIDPVLRALGWDTANTNMVEVEKTLGQVKADYALFDYNKEPKVVVEAKSLGTNLNQPNLIMSLVSYAFQGRLNEVFLTDGIVWSHFDTFQPRNVSPAKTINIETDDPVACAAYLVQHLDAAQFWPEGETIDILAQKINELENTIATLQKDVASLRATCPVNPAGDGQIPTSRPSQIPPGMVFVDLHTITDATGKGVASLRLPDGTVLNTKSWTAVLRECCKFVLSSNPSLSIPFPDRAGRTVALIGTNEPPTGYSFISEQYNGQTVYIYTNYNPNNCVANAVYILEQVPAAQKVVSAAVVMA